MTEKLTKEELASYAHLPLDELDRFCAHSASRSSGPGGQSVNTTDSKVLTRFMPDTSIRATSQRERSQYLNRRANLKKIQKKLLALSEPETPRVDTKPSRTSQAKRIDAKKKRGALKKARTQGFDLDDE